MLSLSFETVYSENCNYDLENTVECNETGAQRDRDRQAQTQTDRETDRRTDIQGDRQTNKQITAPSGRHINHSPTDMQPTR